MSKYAVIRIKGHQYKIQEGQELLVNKIRRDDPGVEVLLFADGEKVRLGKPSLAGVSIDFKVVDQEVKGDKVTVLKYKAKSRYRKKKGFRPRFSRISIRKIT